MSAPRFESPDAIVVGSGPAGASVAIRLASAGWRVVMIDRVPPPRDKLCGEFLSPESEADLRSLGLGEDLRRVGSPLIRRARFSVPSGRVAEFDLPGAGRGLSRLRLDALLWERAHAAGVDVRIGEVVGVEPRLEGAQVEVKTASGRHLLTARWLIGAHGRQRKLDRALEPERGARGLNRYAGLKRHHRPTPELERELADHVEIHVFDGGYCGMSFVEDGVVNVCALVDAGWLRAQRDRRWPALFRAMAASQPRLERRRRSLEPLADRDFITVGAVDLQRVRAVVGPALILGDAAAVIAPLAGDGQAMALSGGRRLARVLVESGPDADFSVVARRWERQFERSYGGRLRIARALQGTLWRPSRAEVLVRCAAAVPSLSRRLAQWTREPVPTLEAENSLDPAPRV